MTPQEITNLALHKIGVSQGVAALDDATREAYTAGQHYDHLLRLTLREFNWPFATAYAELELVAGTVWDDDWADYVQSYDATHTYQVGDVVQSGGALYYCIALATAQAPPNATYWAPADDASTEPPATIAGGDWVYAYREPDDCLRQRRLVPEETGRKHNRFPIPFRKGRDKNGILIYTDRAAAVLEYTLLDCDALFPDDLFIDALTWRIAAAFAPTLSRNKLTAQDCMQFHFAVLQQAAAVARDEEEQEKPGDAEWIEAR